MPGGLKANWLDEEEKKRRNGKRRGRKQGTMHISRGGRRDKALGEGGVP